MPVIHVSNEAHAAVKAHCERLGVLQKVWASRALIDAVRREGPLQPVKKRKLKTYETQETDVLERPPFWGKT